MKLYPERLHATAAACVLVADNDDAALEEVCNMLEEAGYDVVAAFDGEQAWETLRTTRPPPDVVVTDRVRRADGVLLLERIQSDPTVSDTPIVAMTQRTRHPLAGPVAAGAMAYLSKPVRRDVLLAAVEAALHARPGYEPGADGAAQRFLA